MDTLFHDLHENLNKPMELYVYNSKSDIVRICIVMPTMEWNNNNTNSILGATIAHGYLHHLPSLNNNNASDPHLLENIITHPMTNIPKVIQSVFGNHEIVNNTNTTATTTNTITNTITTSVMTSDSTSEVINNNTDIITTQPLA